MSRRPSDIPFEVERDRPVAEDAADEIADLVERVADGIVVVDPDGVVLFANPAAELLFRNGGKQINGLKLDYPLTASEPSVITLTHPVSGPVLVELRSVETTWDSRPAFVVTLHDVTNQINAVESEKRLRSDAEQLNRRIRSVLEINRLISSERDPRRLLRSACRSLISTLGFRAAWAALIDEELGPAFAHAGIDADVAAILTKRFLHGGLPQCCLRLNAQTVVAISTVCGECLSCPLRDSLTEHTGHTVPLRRNSKIYGYLTVYDAVTVGDPAPEFRELQEIADDLSFALANHQMDLRRAQTERILRAAENAAGVGGWEWDFATDRITFSDQWLKIHGCTEEKMSRAGLLAFAPLEVREAWSQAMDAARVTRQPFHLEHLIVRGDTGEIRTVLAHGEITETDGEAVGMFGTTIDVTDQRAASKRIAFQARMLDAIGEAVIVTDPAGAVHYWNPAAEKLYGWSAREVMGRSIIEITPSDDKRAQAAEIMNSLARGDRWEGEFSVKRKDGKAFLVRVSDTPVFDSHGILEAIIEVSSDIAEIERAHERSLQSLRRTAELLESIDDGFLALDSNLVVTYFNRAAESVFSLGREKVLGEQLFDVFPEARGSIFEQKFREAIETKKASQLEAYFEPFEQWYDVRVYPAESGISVFFDLTTERKRLEIEREGLEEQLRQAQKMESIGRLAGGIAHDFNNVLQALTGYAEMLQLHLPEIGGDRDIAGQILQSVHRASGLTQQLLAFARKQTIEPKAVNLNDRIDALLRMLGRLIGEDIRLVWKPLPQLWNVFLDPTQFDQIMVNVVVNARDAIAGPGIISVESRNVTVNEEYCTTHVGFVPGQYAVITVSDTGVGMDRETMKYIFEPFFTTKAQGRGTGLGLATVYGIVRQNNGMINVYSEPGEGTAIRIYLPRLQEDAAPVDTNSLTGDVVRGSETVLVVEDEEPLLKLEELLLDGLGYTVLAANSPKDALVLAREHSGVIDLLLSDIIMPEMNGRELFDRVVKIRPSIKCLFMSGYTDDIISNRGILDREVHFLQKPFSREALAGMLREALVQD